jgi:hypothetical protein
LSADGDLLSPRAECRWRSHGWTRERLPRRLRGCDDGYSKAKLIAISLRREQTWAKIFGDYEFA